MSKSSLSNIDIEEPISKKRKQSQEEGRVNNMEDHVIHHVILFYKYGQLSDDIKEMQFYKEAMTSLCEKLHLTGRILIGISRNSEGINGTLASTTKDDILAFTYALLGQKWCLENVDEKSSVTSCRNRSSALESFWSVSEEFSKRANVPIFKLDTPQDFKWSSVSYPIQEAKNQNTGGLFPDLNVKLVKEIINTGGKLSSITIKDISKGHLTPEEWHDEIRKIENTQDNDTVLIDCRNHKEYEIGHFIGALDPNTKTFEQFPRWVQENKSALENKKVLMYCTGGIRCEKASAFIRNQTDALSVQHLKGGIHKYLDKYGSDGTFKGKNFVFDRRIAAATTELKCSKESHKVESITKTSIVGKCLYCHKNHDIFTADGVCTVCREPVLVCLKCRNGLHGEYHCSDHQHLRNCYFTVLDRFTIDELKSQIEELESILKEIAVGKRFKQKRKTLNRQLDKVSSYIDIIEKENCNGVKNINTMTPKSCRNCNDLSCNGECWGFHGLRRKEKLDGEKNCLKKLSTVRSVRLRANQRSSKVKQKEEDILEIRRLKLSQPPWQHRDEQTSIRCPPPCVRILKSQVKGKWCGRSVASVIQSDFSHSIGDNVAKIMNSGLVRVNEIPIENERALKCSDKNKVMSSDEILKNMDILSRVVHWQEPPVITPSRVPVTKVMLNDNIQSMIFPSSENENDYFVYCCYKPATVPVHPAGPYLSNTLTLMVEAQENMEPRSLLPIHRLDRCVSGLTLCCTNPSIARLLQARMNDGKVSKLYLAKVAGKFPKSESEANTYCYNNDQKPKENASWRWVGGNVIEVDAPIEVIDPCSGIRAVSDKGKQSKSHFCLLSYDEKTDISLIACRPITGRGHQLRVHLQWLGYPIHNDVQYGGSISEKNNMRVEAIKAILNATEKEDLSLDYEGITSQVVKNAKSGSLLYQGVTGIERTFNSAQLMEEGHLIDLHALKYRINFEKKSKKNSDKSSNDTEVAEAIDFSVDMPAWSKTFDDESGIMTSISTFFL